MPAMQRQMDVRPKTILVVEDDDEIRDLEVMLLSDEGYHVLEAADGLHVLPTLDGDHADLILLDLMLPGRDGAGVLEDLSHHPHLADIPVVVVSAWPRDFSGVPQVRASVRKPFDIEELVDEVRKQVGAPVAP